MKYLILCLILLTSCHSSIYEEKLIVVAAKKGTDEYKYKYHIEAFPTYQVLYSNQLYMVGDTLKIYCGD